MSGPVIRGWCPGARRPMMAGDGLVLRIQPPMGQLTPRQAQGLADLADAHATGSIELTSRANLQLRGIAGSGHDALLMALEGLGLIAGDAAAEGRRNFVLNPFRRTDEADRVAALISEGLTSPRFASLPSKFGFALDCAPQRHLAQISADIRIEAGGAGLILRADGCPTGLPVPDAACAAARALDLCAWFIASGGVGADGRGRMRRHLAGGAALPEGLRGDELPRPSAAKAVPGRIGGGICVAAAFGILSAADLRALAQSGANVLRITPWRMIFLPDRAALGLKSSALIRDPHDPILRVWACTGAPGCPQASVETRSLARALAGWLPPRVHLHVAGCAKGCAHPAPAGLTLVGRDGRFDLIRDGAAGDAPQIRGVVSAEVHRFLGG
ncbi:hypothetical protein [Paracoccus ravus]|uniref:hypothetical protein n=1 Tax=Paracoccus ravus TaxID=2447760 RepID=UPI00106E9E4F|nr:hypothetical protein [Paracoccus ravus]